MRRLYVLLALSIFWLTTGYGRAQPSPADSDSFRRITTIAGNGKQAPVMEKGRALSTALSNPFGVQMERDGSLIIVSFDTHVLYRLEPDFRKLERILGTGAAGNAGVAGSQVERVELNSPHEIQIGANGDIYVADTFNHRVGKIAAATGRWLPVAGDGKQGFSGDGDRAVRAQFDQAYSIALDGDELFIADLQNHRIRRVDLESGMISTVAGTGEKAMPQDGGLAIDQPLAGPRSLAIDDESLWIVLREGNSVWRFDRVQKKLLHVAGTGQKGFSGDGGDAKLATFAGPKGIAVDPDRALYIADTENHAIRRIDLQDGLISTIVGKSGKAGFNGDGDQVAERQLARPHGVFLLPSGELLIGDSENHRLRLLEH
ncbi:MAG: hypothetical protein AB8B50_05785 [Pirellulaceae bacterium]